MNRDDFMNFFRDDENLNTLSTDDRREVFASILSGNSDFTKKFLEEVLHDYQVDHLEIVDKTIQTFKRGDRVLWARKHECLLATVVYADGTGTNAVQVKSDCGKTGDFYPDGRWLYDDAYPSLTHA